MSLSPAPLRLGMFVMPIHDPAKPWAQCLDEDLELAVACEAACVPLPQSGASGVPYWDIELKIDAAGTRLLMTVNLWLVLAVVAGLSCPLAGWPGLWWARWRLRRGGQPGGGCGRCGYSVRGVVSGVCPECGGAYERVGVHVGAPRWVQALPVMLWVLLAPLPLVLAYVLVSEWTFPQLTPTGAPVNFWGYVHPWWAAGPGVAAAVGVYAVGLWVMRRCARRWGAE